jgi:hypothetical protein
MKFMQHSSKVLWIKDCTFRSPIELNNFNLHDVVENITIDAPGGLYAAGRGRGQQLFVTRGIVSTPKKRKVC